jgi:MoxR-like ATPase
MIPDPATCDALMSASAAPGEAVASEALWGSIYRPAQRVPHPNARERQSCDEPVAFDTARAIAEVKRAFSSLDRALVGFEPLLIQTVYALLTRENLLVFSPAGTAKTLCARLIFDRIRGARVFDTQMSKGTLAEELFGSIDIEQMKRGRVLHNTTNTLVDADFAFIDELFDANDMVLRALLGILNERVFKKGCQLEKARLHTGIAATNYLRASEVTEAVLDRFLLRSYIAPDYEPYALLAIDQCFGRGFGRPSATPADEQIPLETLGRLADIVQGRHPTLSIAVPPHVMFLKNLVLNRYRELLAQCATEGKRRPLYISPRTYAKSRLVLNAAALLRGRMEANSDDLSQLKYVVTTIGGSDEQSQCFDKALSETLTRLRPADHDAIDQLTAAGDLAEQVMQRLRNGEEIVPSGFLERLLRWLGLLGDGELGFHHVRRYVESIQPRDEQVKQLKLGFLRRIDELVRRVDDTHASILY